MTQPGHSTENTLSRHTAPPHKPSAELPSVQDGLKDKVEPQTLSHENSSTETPLTEKISVDAPLIKSAPLSTADPSATKEDTQQNCNSNNSQGKDDQAPIDATLEDMTNVNSGAHTDLNVKGNGSVVDEKVPESQEQNAKRHSSSSSTTTTESSFACKKNSNIEMPHKSDEPDGAHAVDGSAPPNPPTSQPKSHKLIRGRKKSNKEGNLCMCVCMCVCLILHVSIAVLCGFTK